MAILLVMTAVACAVGGLVGLAVLVGRWLWAPRVNERARLNGEAEQATWQIHRLASEAFSQMLDTARQSQRNRGQR